MRNFSLFLVTFALAAACGGKIDDGTDGGTEGGTDSPPPICKPGGSACTLTSDCCSGMCADGICAINPSCTPSYQKCGASSECCTQICDPGSSVCVPNGPPPPPPGCQPDGTTCSSTFQCCSLVCGPNGVCGGPQPPPPPPTCQPDGTQCFSSSQCCSNDCSNGTCGGINVGCASTSNKLCDQCVDQYCCPYEIACGNDALCSKWQSCIQNCEQQGGTGSSCSQTVCNGPMDSAQYALYQCGSQYCSQQCLKD
jgi:hypothetical protein